MVMLPAEFLLLRITLAIHGVLCFHGEFYDFFPISVNNITHCIFDLVCIESVACFQQDGQFLMVFPTNEHGRSYHLPGSSSQPVGCDSFRGSTNSSQELPKEDH